MPASTMNVLGPSGRELEPTEAVGFSTLPDQLVNRELSRGFTFNVLCIGDAGLGKTTLVESLFKQTLEEEANAVPGAPTGLEILQKDLQEGGVNLKLTIASAVDLGEALDRTDSAKPALGYINAQFESYLQEELKTTRCLAEYEDTRVHVCLFLLPPTGHTLRSLDLVMLKKLQGKVSIVPVIAKADTVTREELAQFRTKIMQEFEQNDIAVFQPEEFDGEEVHRDMPFAVVGSQEVITMGGTSMRVRQYPWGLVEVENEEHSDLPSLRQMLLRTHMQALRTAVHSRYYESYRVKRLTEMGFADTNERGETVSAREALEAKRQEHLRDLASREEKMRQVFVQKVKLKESQLKTSEQQLKARFEDIQKMNQRDTASMKQAKEQLEAERTQWLEAVRREAEANAANTGKKHKKDKHKKDKH